MLKKVRFTPITYGHILASWQIIMLSSIHSKLTPKKAVEISLRSGKLGGTFPAKQGLKLCLDYDLIQIKSGILVLSEISLKRLLPVCNNDEPNIDVLRKILFHIISHHNFEWLIYYDPDPVIFKTYLEEYDLDWVNLLDNARLFEFECKKVNKWWELVLSKYEDYKNKVKKAIGDVGEKLTYSYELKRIEIDKISPAKSYVKWASNLSDRFGFDILSIRGNLFKSSFLTMDKIQIEVKSSSSSNTERFRFFVSKNEWSKALENLNSYYFYCWSGINIDKESYEQGPFIIPAAKLEPMVPDDKHEICSWSECRFVLNVSDFTVT